MKNIAIEELQNRILQFINDSILDQLYSKALDCLIALREGCIQEEESESFNNFLKKIRNICEGKRRNDFWKLIIEKKITLIHSEESEDSTISPEEAKEVIFYFIILKLLLF